MKCLSDGLVDCQSFIDYTLITHKDGTIDTNKGGFPVAISFHGKQIRAMPSCANGVIRTEAQPIASRAQPPIMMLNPSFIAINE